FKIPAAFCIMRCEVEVQVSVQTMMIQKLVMSLGIIVHFVGMRGSGFFRSGGMVGSQIIVVDVLGRHAVPGLVGGFVAGEYIEFQGMLFSKISPGKVKRAEVSRCSVYKTIGSDARRAAIECEF